MNYEKEAEFLMASMMEHNPGEIGMELQEWTAIYGRLPSTQAVKKQVVGFLKAFASRVIEKANEERMKSLT